MLLKYLKRLILVCTFVIYLWPPWVHGAYEMSACVDCHREGSRKSVLHIPIKAYENSVHGREITCTECHTNIVDDGHMALNNSEKVNCNACHEQKNPHGLGASGVKTRPQCYSCHTRHAILTVGNPASSVNEKHLPHTCGTCHPAEAGNAGWMQWLPTVHVRTHGKQDFACDFDEADCLGCHQGAAAHGEKKTAERQKMPELSRVHPEAVRNCRPHSRGGTGAGQKLPRGFGGDLRFGLRLVGMGRVPFFSCNGFPGKTGGDEVPLTGFDILLTAVSLVVFLVGLERLRASWRMGRDEACAHDLKGLMGYLLGHRKILRRPMTGTAHLLVFWGFLYSLLMGILPQFGIVFPAVPAGILSLFSDVAGLGLLAGLVYLLARRLNKGIEKGPRGAVPAVLLLMVMGLSGFLAEGTRLAIMDVPWGWRTPVGGLVAYAMPASPLFMQAMIRLHFFSVLLFVATVPFSFMGHIVSASLNVYSRPKRPPGALRDLPLDERDGPKPVPGVQSVFDFTWKQLLDVRACVSCGRCDEVCPALISRKPLSPREMMQAIRLFVQTPDTGSLENSISADALWACTNCMACVAVCPVYAAPMEKLMDMRRGEVLRRGNLPEAARPMMRDLRIYGDVNGRGAAHREDWAVQSGVPVVSRDGLDGGFLLWVGCSGAFHPRYRETTRALVRILQAADVRFGILGREESCCGDPARRLGDEDLFRSLAHKNIEAFQKYGVKKMICLCPHGYNTLKNEYPSLGGAFDIMPAAGFVLELIRDNRISLKYPLDFSMAIHDPCYLGRANGLYDPLRALVSGIPGIRLKELAGNRENAFCCGGGGGRMWLHENLGRNINHLRSLDVAEAGVDVVGTACPFCLTMLEDGINGLEMENPPRVMDLIEAVDSAMGRLY